MGEAFIRSRVRSRLPRFIYMADGADRAEDQNYVKVLDEGHGNWRIKFLSSGTLTFKTNAGLNHGIDVFLVGGGGNSSYSHIIHQDVGIGDGGGGYTKTHKNVSAVKGTAYTVTVGAATQASSAFGYTANAGANGTSGVTDMRPYGGDIWAWGVGGDGGSGGAGSRWDFGSNGGRDGGNGGGNAGGTGQGTTTREFGETGGTLYSNGGGANSANVANSGNGAYWGSDRNRTGGHNGCSGIVVIRNCR